MSTPHRKRSSRVAERIVRGISESPHGQRGGRDRSRTPVRYRSSQSPPQGQSSHRKVDRGRSHTPRKSQSASPRSASPGSASPRSASPRSASLGLQSPQTESPTLGGEGNLSGGLRQHHAWLQVGTSVMLRVPFKRHEASSPLFLVPTMLSTSDLPWREALPSRTCVGLGRCGGVGFMMLLPSCHDS